MVSRSFLLVSVGLLVLFGHVGAGQHAFFDFFQEKIQLATAPDEDYAGVLTQYHDVRNYLKNNPDHFLGERNDQNAAVPWSANVSQSCKNDIMLVIQYLQKKEQWAMQFIDAAGKPEAAIFQGNLRWLGSFDECLAIVAQMNNETEFRGKYCLATIGPAINNSGSAEPNPFSAPTVLSLQLGICFPDSCTDQDTTQLVLNLLTMIPEQLNVTLEAYSVTCQPKGYDYDMKAIIMLSVISVFGLLIVIGTLYDLVLYQPLLKKVTITTTTRTESTSYPPIGTDQPPNGHMEVEHTEKVVVEDGEVAQEVTEKLVETDDDDAPLLGSKEPLVNEKVHIDVKISEEIGIFAEMLLAFSVYSNGKKILATGQTDKSLNCIHGIRFLSMSWVLLGHSYAFGFFTVRNIAVVPALLGDFWFQAIANATVAVDTFFTMSGLLVCYLFVLNFHKTKKIPIIQYYIHRYWRLTAVYMFIMGVYLSLFKYLNSGPQWNPEGMEVNSCSSTWWTNLLYVNNLVRTDQACMGWTWYLANDMQFYWISPLILIPLVKAPIIGLAVMAVFFVAHIVTTAVLAVEYDFAPSIVGNGDLTGFANGFQWDYFNLYYVKPWTRIGPYLIGMAFGFLLARFKDEKVKIRKDLAAFIWLVATISALAVLYGLYDVNNGTPLSSSVAALYNVLHRNVWAAAVCWVIFACVQGYGGFVNTILSWNALVPLSRLTYCCYLIHLPVMLIFYLSRTTTIDFSHLAIVYYFFGTLMVTYGFAFLFTVGVESPLLGLEKLIEKKAKG